MYFSGKKCRMYGEVTLAGRTAFLPNDHVPSVLQMATQGHLKHCSWTSHGLLVDLSMTALGYRIAITVLWVMIPVLLNPLFIMSKMNQEMYGAIGKTGNKTYYKRDGKTIARIIVTATAPVTSVAVTVWFTVIAQSSDTDTEG